MEEFWMVWCEEQGMPKVKHLSVSSAEKEAERLARLHPGARFYVLSCEKYAWVIPRAVDWVKLDEIPS